MHIFLYQPRNDEPRLTVVQQEDHEIFDLVTELEAAEGKGTTFYSWLDVPSTASTNDIAKAYRKKSMLLQSVFFYSRHLPKY